MKNVLLFLLLTVAFNFCANGQQTDTIAWSLKDTLTIGQLLKLPPAYTLMATTLVMNTQGEVFKMQYAPMGRPENAAANWNLILTFLRRFKEAGSLHVSLTDITVTKDGVEKRLADKYLYLP